jgi:hypothetical protein
MLINLHYSASLRKESKVEQHLPASTMMTSQKENVGAAISLNNVSVSSSVSNSHAMEQQQQHLEQATNKDKEKKEWAPAISYRIVLTSRYKSVQELPDLFRKNVQNTIQKYQELWGDKFEEVWFLGNKECQNAIKQADVRLLESYLWETIGPYKANICRGAACSVLAIERGLLL